jgi:hypothetical protein
MGLRGPHAGPKAWWRYAQHPKPNCRCRYCYRLFIGDRNTAAFCSDACKQADYRERLAARKKFDDRATFTIVLRAEKRVSDPVKSLRALLKIAGRQFGLKAVTIKEQPQPDDIAA